MRLRELCALLALVTLPCNAATRRRRRKGAPQATALPTNGAWNASSLAEPWREPWYEHWRRGRADGRAAWGRLDAYERAWARVVGTGRHRAQIVYFFRMQIGSRTPSGIGLGSDSRLGRMRPYLEFPRELWIEIFGKSWPIEV